MNFSHSSCSNYKGTRLQFNRLLLFLVSLSLLFLSCSKKETDTLQNSNDGTVSIMTGPQKPMSDETTINKNDTIDLSIDISGDSTDLFLIALTNVSLTIDGCISGFTNTFILTGTVQVYRNDRNCRVKVNGFTNGSENYVVKSGYTFDTTVGVLTPFTGNLGNLSGELFVQVLTQLPDPITTGVSVSFRVIDLKKENDYPITITSNILAVYADQTTVAEGVATQASFTIKKVTQADTNALTVNYSIGGTAISGSDYTAVSGSIIIPANQTSVVLVIPLIDDTLAEQPKTIEFMFENGGYYSYGNPVINLTDTDTAITTTNRVIHLTPASIVATNGTTIDSWTDTSGIGNNAIQATLANRPLRVLNSLNGQTVAQFDGSTDILTFPSGTTINSAASYTNKVISLVFVTGSDVTRRQIIYDQGTNGAGLNIYIDQGRIYANTWNTNVNDATTPWDSRYVNAFVAANTAYSFSLVYSYTSFTVNSLKAYISGSYLGTMTGVGRLFGSTEVATIGGAGTGSRFHDNSTTITSTFFGGSVAELVHYNGALTEFQLQGVHAYLDSKFNLSSPVVSIKAINATVNETSGTVPKAFVVTREIATSNDLVVAYTTSGTAVAGTHYQTLSGSVTIPANLSTAYIPVTIINDSTPQNDRTLILTLNSSSSYQGPPANEQITIMDDDNFAAPSSLFTWYNAPEGLQFATGALVSVWNDKMVTNLDASQSTATARPTYNSSTQSLDFDGADFLTIPSNALLDTPTTYTKKTFAVVFKTSSNMTSKQVVFEEGSSTTGVNIVINAGTIYFTCHNNESGTTFDWGPSNVTGTVAANTLYAAIFEFDNPALQQRGLLNRTTLTTVAIANTSKRLGPHGSSNTAIGGLSGTIRTFNSTTTGGFLPSGSKVYELMLFSDILTSTQMTDLKNYLYLKYNL
ncbi:MAG: hypothetical protein KA436_00765 [Oligoflexales bacterium]|nr:hypothetical protein [Oligoflexales bacterium]